MNMKKVLALFSAATMAVALSACATGAKMEPAKNGYYKQKAVYHINDIDSANGALRNVKNHLNAVGDENSDIIVVTHSKGAFTLVDGAKDAKGKEMKDQVNTLANRGVKFQICANTIRGKKIDKNKININAEVVPSGVAQIAHLQQMGYYYIKP
ncbi:MAG: DsrE family protein [Gammaproteobacteria bacterium]|nr:DsrE family protein [Gammaproteobacteria bacterium]